MLLSSVTLKKAKEGEVTAGGTELTDRSGEARSGARLNIAWHAPASRLRNTQKQQQLRFWKKLVMLTDLK